MKSSKEQIEPTEIAVISNETLGEAYIGRPWTTGSPYGLKVESIPTAQKDQIIRGLREGNLEALLPFVVGMSDMIDEGCDIEIRKFSPDEEESERGRIGNDLANAIEG